MWLTLMAKAITINGSLCSLCDTFPLTFFFKVYAYTCNCFCFLLPSFHHTITVPTIYSKTSKMNDVYIFDYNTELYKLLY